MKRLALILFAALALSACSGGGEPVGWGGSVNEVHMSDGVTCYVVVTATGDPKSIDCLAR